MTSLATTADDETERFAAEAGRLLGRPVTAISALGGGGNNRVYRVTADGCEYALKTYPRDPSDPRNRLDTEYAGLEFLVARGVDCVPVPVARDAVNGIALYQWIQGRPIKRPGTTDVDAAAAFVERLRGTSRDSGAADLNEASEACLSGRAAAKQTRARRDRLIAASGPHPELASFLADKVGPALERMTAGAAEKYQALGLDFEADIGKSKRTLSPSDFGFHNALLTASGDIAFVDFEYFGWDDPVKLTADFLLHPGFEMDDRLKRRFAGAMKALFSDDESFGPRLGLLFPLFALRWTMILLNEFLPGRLARRRYAGAGEENAVLWARQLDKARAMLFRAVSAEEAFPYD